LNNETHVFYLIRFLYWFSFLGNHFKSMTMKLLNFKFERRKKYAYNVTVWRIRVTVGPGTHYPHVTWAHVMLRVKLGREKRFTIEFCGADSHFCHSAYVTCSHVPIRLSHFCCRTHFMRRDDVTTWRCDEVSNVSRVLQTLSVGCLQKNILFYVSGYTETDTTGKLSPPPAWRQKLTWDNVTWRYACVPPHTTWAHVTWE